MPSIETKNLLRERFPSVFGPKWRPLKIGVLNDLIEALGPNVPPRQIQRLIISRTSRIEYLQAISLGGHRYNLAGEVDGEITPSDQEYAHRRLAEEQARRHAASEAIGHRSRFLKAFEASGMSLEEYAANTGIPLSTAHSDYDRGTYERALRRAKREVLSRKFEASGLTVEQFAESHKVKLAFLLKAIEYGKALRADTQM